MIDPGGAGTSGQDIKVDRYPGGGSSLSTRVVRSGEMGTSNPFLLPADQSSITAPITEQLIYLHQLIYPPECEHRRSIVWKDS